MLAHTAAAPFDSDQHLFEIKWDGTRCIAYVEAEGVRLLNRRNFELRDRYPELAGLRKLPTGTILDGEIVVLDERGKPSFNRLAQREHLTDAAKIELVRRRMPATLMIFDLLYLSGQSWLKRPLLERRAKLEALTRELRDPHLLVPDYVLRHGKQYFAAVERAGLEGMMAKQIDSPYQPGKRSRHWLKIKVARTQAFDIIGYVPREGEPVISALAVGAPLTQRPKRSSAAARPSASHSDARSVQDRGWTYKGNVGSGFTENQRAELYEALATMPPLNNPPRDAPREIVWRRTGLRCLVRFFEETEDGKLRGPVFLGLAPPPAH